MKKIFAAALMSTGLFGSVSFAHSDYWRCAAASGSYAYQNCGSREYYDRTGRFGYGNGYDGYYGGYRYYRPGYPAYPGYRHGYRHGRWNVSSADSNFEMTAEVLTGTCFKAKACQGEAIQNVSVEACQQAGGASFMSSMTGCADL